MSDHGPKSRNLRKTTNRPVAAGSRIGLAIAAIIAWAAPAFPSMMSLAGPDPAAPGAAATTGADVLYATARTGREVQLAQVGLWRGLDVRDLGMPFVGDDGTVFFSVGIARDREMRWKIFRADPDRRSVSAIEIPDSLEMRADPRPIATPDGALIFSVTDPVEGVYELHEGELSCLLRPGQRLNGRVVHRIALGSLDAIDENTLALIAFFEPHQEAELLLSGGDAKTLAVAGEPTSDGARFALLGQPALALEDGAPRVIFSARTSKGYNLYDFSRGRLRRLLAADALCPRAEDAFIPDQKVELDERGILVSSACSGRSMNILIAPNGEIALEHAGSYGPLHPAMANLPSHSIEAASMSVNRGGQAAYLGGPRRRSQVSTKLQRDDSFQ